MLGEMRDATTADIAIKLANTGHLTFSTLHTNDAPSAVTRLADMGVEDSGASDLIHAVYQILGLRTFFTANPKEARAWTIRAGSKAPQAAGKIHTDMEKGFIRMEVTPVDTLIELGSEQAVKAAGKQRLEGKDYVVVDGDVVVIRFNK